MNMEPRELRGVWGVRNRTWEKRKEEIIQKRVRILADTFLKRMKIRVLRERLWGGTNFRTDI